MSGPPSQNLAGVLLAALAVFTTLAGGYAGASERFSYDPSTCATDPEGMEYSALGRVVLRMPAEEITMIGNLPERMKSDRPRPPDPSEPEGCPGHPRAVLNLTFAYYLEALRDNKYDPNARAGKPEILQLIGVRPDFWGLQPSEEKRFRNRCERFGEREELEIGFVGCRTPMTDKSKPRSHWAIVYQARPEVYAAPFGRPFVVGCSPGVTEGSHLCRVSYKLYETLNVSYRFRLRDIPITEIIAFDRGLRAKVEAARVKDFVWPDEEGR